ncbi:hypothetical protein GCM10010441_27190 [Kitasatospora paracochleata]
MTLYRTPCIAVNSTSCTDFFPAGAGGGEAAAAKWVTSMVEVIAARPYGKKSVEVDIPYARARLRTSCQPEYGRSARHTRQ